MTIFKKRKRVIACLLAVAVVGGSISAPAYQHAHSEGNVAHNHQTENRRQHANTHAHGGHRHVAHHSVVSEAPARHAHVSLFGIELSIPKPDGDNSDPPQPTHDEPTFVVLAVGNCLPTAGCGDIRHGRAVTKAQFLSNIAVLSVPTRKYSQPTAASILLCDTARFERSGVMRC